MPSYPLPAENPLIGDFQSAFMPLLALVAVAVVLAMVQKETFPTAARR